MARAGALSMAAFVVAARAAWGWSGEAWDLMSREEMVALADEMIDSTWTPNATIRIWQFRDVYSPYYYPDTTYTGIAYTQDNPQENWAEFVYRTSVTSPGDQRYGNDCSGFLSICWRLPYRSWTADLESSLGTYWESLGPVGGGASVTLFRGDALNKAGDHCLLVNRYVTDGVESLEQTPNNARRRTWTWSQLAQYRPIRRMAIAGDSAAPTGVNASDGAYADRVRVTWNPVPGATAYRVYRSAGDNPATAAVARDWSPDTAFDDFNAPAPTRTPIGGCAADDPADAVPQPVNYWVQALTADGESAYSLPDAGHRGAGPGKSTRYRTAGDLVILVAVAVWLGIAPWRRNQPSVKGSKASPSTASGRRGRP